MIQIDMQMPKNCLECPACNEYLMCAIPVNGRKWGENDVRDFSQGRPDWCPMKEQELIWCKDCVYSHKRERDGAYHCNIHGIWKPDGNWFCADGERRTDDGRH